MELGEKLRLARQEAGLSQRQLCGTFITRNMLSLIEHGTASPSMDTLRYLAGQLGKPVSWFLEEDVVMSPNQLRMDAARKAWHSGAYAGAKQLLRDFQEPDPMLEWEWKYLSFMTDLAEAQMAMEDGKLLYARQLLDQAAEIDHGVPGLERQRLLLLGKLPGSDLDRIAKQLPSLDEELLLRAEAALTAGNAVRAEALLQAAEDQQTPKWNFLLGRTLAEQKRYHQAAVYLGRAEEAFPKACQPLLEVCFRELGDFQKAYEYACKQR